MNLLETLKGRLIFVGAILVTPLFIVGWLLFQQMSVAIQFGEKEILGTVYLRPLQVVLDEAGSVRAQAIGTSVSGAYINAWKNFQSTHEQSVRALDTASAYSDIKKAIDANEATVLIERVTL